MFAMTLWTSFFDVSKERPNEINPIPGESLLVWMAKELTDEARMTAPDMEDWGWYSTLDFDGRSYMIGAVALDERVDGRREWVLQIDKHRSFKERLLGREKLTDDDLCVLMIRELIENEPEFVDVSVMPEQR